MAWGEAGYKDLTICRKFADLKLPIDEGFAFGEIVNPFA